MSQLKEEKRQAKEQDKAYVDYRKAEILHEIKPRTKAFNLKKFDDSFPRPNKKKEANMEYGELMHKYLSLRPDPRFATWHGKSAEKRKRAEEKRKAAAPQKEGMLQKLTKVTGVKKPAKSTVEKSKKPTKNYNKAVKNVLMQQANFEEDEVDQKRLSEAYKFLPKDEVDAKNKYTLNAIVDNKPFWLVGDPVVPEDEEEAYVDADMLTTYMASNCDATQYPTNLAERKKFFIWGPTPQLWTEMVHFQNKKLIIGNTLKSIVESNADLRGVSKERNTKEHKTILTWCKTTKGIDYVMDSAPLEKTAIYEGQLQNIQKENAKKE